jgi:hypothetical protein
MTGMSGGVGRRPGRCRDCNNDIYKTSWATAVTVIDGFPVQAGQEKHHLWNSWLTR